MKNAFLTFHARKRMRELGISEAEVRATLAAPFSTWPGRRTEPTCQPTIHARGQRILILVTADWDRVITVKLNTDSPYTHGVHDIMNLPAA